MTRWDLAGFAVVTAINAVMWLEPWTPHVRLHLILALSGYCLFDLGRRLGRACS